MFWDDGHIGIHPKRSFLYPAVLTALHPVPGRLSLDVILVQHALALAVMLLAVKLRREFCAGAGWLDWALVLVVGLNAPLLFYAHDMMAEIWYAAAFLLFLWRFWRFLKRPGISHAAGVLWAAALAIAIRPDGRMALMFSLPVMIVLMAIEWNRGMRIKGAWKMALPLAACLGLSFDGRVTQEGWLFYSSVFPLTNLESPLHAEYKAELRPWVETARQDLREYPGMQHDMQGRLGHRKGSIGPKWDALKGSGQDRRLHQKCRDLAIEAVRSHPFMFLRLLGYKLRYVLGRERDVAPMLRPRKMGSDWSEQMKAEPGYIPLLWGDEMTWVRWRDGYFSRTDDGPVAPVIARLEPVTSPPWWGFWGLLGLVGWALAVWRNGWRLALWLCVIGGSLALTFAIARGITRYLLPFEPLWAIGVALLIVESWRRLRPAAR